MSRIDHAAEARKLVAWGEEWMGEEGSTDATNIASAMHAQTHATLALVEQQRIANIIKVGGHRVASLPVHQAPTLADLRPEIAAALGLTEGQEGPRWKVPTREETIERIAGHPAGGCYNDGGHTECLREVSEAVDAATALQLRNAKRPGKEGSDG